MKEIRLTQGKTALVDDEDFEEVNQYKWYAQLIEKNWYAIRNLPGAKGKKIYMHRSIKPGLLRIDHKDGDGLNNQKNNLRPSTNGQNIANSRKRRGCSSRYKGVTWHKHNKTWKAQISVSTKMIHLGSFDSEILAAQAYDSAARRHFKEFARLNFP